MAAMKLFVWDFHGVLEKGNENAVFEVSNKILEQSGYKERFTVEENLRLYGQKWYQYFEYLLPYETTKKHLQLQKMCVEFGNKYPSVIQSFIKPNDYAHEVLEKTQTKHKQILVSNMSKASLFRFMNAVGVTKFFSRGKAFAINSHQVKLEKGKSEVLRDFLNGRNFDYIVVIGDKPEDVEMKSVAGGVSYLYSHPGRDFPNCDADYRINCLKEVLKEI